MKVDCIGRCFPPKHLCIPRKTKHQVEKFTRRDELFLFARTHKVKPLLIGKSKNLRPFRNVHLPISYDFQKNAWMTRDILKRWFQRDFISQIRNYLKSRNLLLKALLILDNCPGHPHEEELISDDGLIKTMYLPPNVTNVIQTIDQKVIQCVKINYRKKLLYKILREEDSVVTEVLKSVNVKDAVSWLCESWDAASERVLKAAWQKLWSVNEDDEMDIEENFPNEFNLRSGIEELSNLMTALKHPNQTEEDIMEWIDGDSKESHKTLSDDEIVANVLNADENVEETEEHSFVSHKSAFNAFETCIEWVEENGCPLPELLILRRMKEKSFKYLSEKKQKRITDYMYFS